jgi:hypothetical protein
MELQKQEKPVKAEKPVEEAKEPVEEPVKKTGGRPRKK